MQSVWHGEQRKHEIHDKARQKILNIGYQVEKEAKETIMQVVYDTPASPNYRRTMLALNSIQTVEKTDGVYVGSDINKFKAIAPTYGVEVGGLTFYLPYIEFRHTMRDGTYYPARPFLRPALDKVRIKHGGL